MFRSATFKLTLWYLAIVMAISLIFSFALYHVTVNELAHGLHHEMQMISSNFPVFTNSPYLKTGRDLTAGEHRIILRLVIFNIAVLFAAGFASYWLARRTLQPIEEAHEQQKRFTSDVSHELRTPLTALRMESEVALLNDDSTKEELRGTIISNLEEVGKLETLINNLLRLTRLEVEALQENFQAFDAKKLASSSTALVAQQAKTREVTIKQSVSAPAVYGDEASLEQLLVILLDNAVKYSKNGDTITLGISEHDAHTVVNVRDHGTGIEKEALNHVFDRFYRADSARNKTTTEGFGLGLSIAKMIVDVHHGSIEISSKLNHGTNVTITLPTQLPKKT